MKNKIVKLTELNITLDSNGYSYSQIKEMLQTRKESVLSKAELVEKLKCGEAAFVSEQVVVYVDRTNRSPMSKVHFYNLQGNLMFTYPWNGEIFKEMKLNKETLKFEYKFEMVDSRKTSFCFLKGRKEIKSLECVATDSKKIAINDLSSDCNNEESWRFSLFTAFGKEEMFTSPASVSNYSDYHLTNKDYQERNRNWFKAIASEGDKILNYVSGESYIK